MGHKTLTQELVRTRSELKHQEVSVCEWYTKVRQIQLALALSAQGLNPRSDCEQFQQLDQEQSFGSSKDQDADKWTSTASTGQSMSTASAHRMAECASQETRNRRELAQQEQQRAMIMATDTEQIEQIAAEARSTDDRYDASGGHTQLSSPSPSLEARSALQESVQSLRAAPNKAKNAAEITEVELTFEEVEGLLRAAVRAKRAGLAAPTATAMYRELEMIHSAGAEMAAEGGYLVEEREGGYLLEERDEDQLWAESTGSSKTFSPATTMTGIITADPNSNVGAASAAKIALTDRAVDADLMPKARMAGPGNNPVQVFAT
jgi:hypothetical protein